MKLRSVLLALSLSVSSIANAQPPTAQHVVVPVPPRVRRVVPPPAPPPPAHTAEVHAAPKPVVQAPVATRAPKIPAPKTIIFDWDGTIGDTFPQLKYAASRAFKDIGVTPTSSVPGEDPYKSIIDAQGLDGMCKRGLPNATPAQLKQWADRFNFHSANAPDELVALKPGARAELDTLKKKFPGTKFAVLSARPQAILEKMIKLTGTTDMFEMVVGTADSKIAPKPAPDGVKAILTKLSVDPKDAMMVGDHENDILAGKAAGTKTVAVKDGMGHVDALDAAKPDFSLDHLDLSRDVFVTPAKVVEARP